MSRDASQWDQKSNKVNKTVKLVTNIQEVYIHDLGRNTDCYTYGWGMLLGTSQLFYANA
jgi:hypothetical protein